MKGQQISIKLSISKPNRGDDREVVSIRVKDNASLTRFLEIEIDAMAFSNALFGMAEQPGVAIVQGFENLGKTKETKSITLDLPVGMFEREVVASYIIGNYACPKGWQMDLYLGSQGSIRNGKANFTIYRYVDQGDE